MSKSKQRGFSVVEAIIAVFVVAAIGVAGYLAYNRVQDTAKAPTASEQTARAVTPSAPTVKDTTDLDAAAKTLDETNLDATASDQIDLDTELSNF